MNTAHLYPKSALQEWKNRPHVDKHGSQKGETYIHGNLLEGFAPHCTHVCTDWGESKLCFAYKDDGEKEKRPGGVFVNNIHLPEAKEENHQPLCFIQSYSERISQKRSASGHMFVRRWLHTAERRTPFGDSNCMIATILPGASKDIFVVVGTYGSDEMHEWNNSYAFLMSLDGWWRGVSHIGVLCKKTFFKTNLISSLSAQITHCTVC